MCHSSSAHLSYPSKFNGKNVGSNIAFKNNKLQYFYYSLNDVCVYFQLMLDSWNQSIFSNIKHRLQDSAMKLVHAERNGEAFDSQLVIGVRESYGKYTVFLVFKDLLGL